MTKLDKIFEEIGYKPGPTLFNQDLKYYKDDDNVITISLSHHDFYKSGKYDEIYDPITMKELQAIYQFCKERGWLDVK